MSKEIRAICPECGSITQSGKVKAKFYVNTETMMGYCHHCEFKGKFSEALLDNLEVISTSEAQAFKPAKFAPLSEEAHRYLTKRFPGVEASQLDAFGLGYHAQYHAIAIPSLSPDQKVLQGVKYRFLAPINERFAAEQGSIFGGYWIQGDSDKLLIVEGEFDAITARVSGFNGSILALQTNKLSGSSITHLQKFTNIFLCLDADEAGEAGRISIESLLQGRLVYSIQLPADYKDLNEFLQKEGRHAVDRFLKGETKTQIERDTRTLSDCVPKMLEFLSNIKNTEGFSTGYKSLDYLLGGGLRPSEMTVVNAFAKTGKTSFITNIAHNLAKSGLKVGIASFEMRAAEMTFPTLLTIASKTNIRTIEPEKLAASVEIINQDCSYLNSNLVVFERFGVTAWSDIEAWATMIKNKLDVSVLVLDHAGFMVEDMTDAKENQILAKNIKKLTNILGLHILVVVQAPKTKDGLSIQTAYGGMAWGQNTDNYIILERAKDDDMRLDVRIEYVRYPGGRASSTPVMMYYDRESCGLSD